MSLPIITADQRLAEPCGIKGCIFGKSGIGKTRVLEMGMIAKKDLKLFSLVDSSEEACRLVKEGWERMRQESPEGA